MLHPIPHLFPATHIKVYTLTVAILQMTSLLNPDMELGVDLREVHFHRWNQPGSPLLLAEFFQPMEAPAGDWKDRGGRGWGICPRLPSCWSGALLPSLCTQAVLWSLLLEPQCSLDSINATQAHTHTPPAHVHTRTYTYAHGWLPTAAQLWVPHQPCWLPLLHSHLCNSSLR